MKNVGAKLSWTCVLLFTFLFSCDDDREKLEEILSDNEAPTEVTGLSASEIKTESLLLSWNAATDNIKVAKYEVFQDGESIGFSNTTSLEIAGLQSNTEYGFSVKAIDGEGNESSMSDILTVSTAEEEDTEKPTAPSNVTFSNLTASSVTISWSAATDNEEVVNYEVFQDGVSIGKTEGELSLSVAELTPATTYEFYVVAEDIAGNVSDNSETIAVTTETEEDTEAPTTPTGLEATNITGTSFTLSWSASTDNNEVANYEIFQNSVSVGTSTELSFEVTGLEAATSYQYTVQAIDASGNTSEMSEMLEVTTLDEEPTQSILEIIIEREDLSTLQSTLESTGFSSTLEEDGPFTVFAPNNSAFEAYGTLPSGILLNRLIANHVIGGDVAAEELLTLGTAETGLGSTLTFTEDGNGDIIVNGEAKIIIKNIKATNGTLQIVDAIVPIDE
ncbi:fibronectin type III domain-containing protein [Galbibacter mesophilus]|uniref:fibronectin type III domain-containing protein n=1 Tax=Galbibacter mesophilus TaxID=379069 RepID=UPI00191F4B2A|nr:fibronectin type III domain-containing protein [Galbibacter mesophilus]MCM5663188.1 fibronectin type III domain-containing protein [Galbibacter mesophilus]